MKSVKGWIEMERLLPGEGERWRTIHQYRPDVSIEQARQMLGMAIPVLPGTEHRLVYVRVETTREVLD